MYPDKHRDIVESLLDGQFITAEDVLFEMLRKHEEFYTEFFDRSFGYNLQGGMEYYYLVSPTTSEYTSRDITIFFAILCYELDKDGRNFLEELRYSEFSMEEIIDYFKNSSWAEIIRANKQLSTADSLQRFMSTLAKRNIVIKQGNDAYTFSLAHKFFVDFARDLLE